MSHTITQATLLSLLAKVVEANGNYQPDMMGDEAEPISELSIDGYIVHTERHTVLATEKGNDTYARMPDHFKRTKKDLLDAALRNLATTRETVNVVSAAYKEVFEAFKTETAPLLAARDDANTVEHDAYAAAIKAALAVYRDTGEAKVDRAVTVKLMNSVEIKDEDAAIRWAIDRGLYNLLKLNESAFNKVVQAGIVPEHLAVNVKTPKPNISSDLSDRLPPTGGNGWSSFKPALNTDTPPLFQPSVLPVAPEDTSE